MVRSFSSMECVMLGHFQVKQLALVIPFVQCMGGVEPFITLQANKIGLQGAGHYFGYLCFALHRPAFYKQGLL